MPTPRLMAAAAQAGDVSLEFIRGALPATLDAEAQAIADSPYTCLVETRAFNPSVIPRLAHLVARRNGRLLGVLSVHEQGHAVVVVNQCVAFPAQTLALCARQILAEYPAATRVELLNACDIPAEDRTHLDLARRYDRGTENYVARLPATVAEWAAEFSPRTLQRLRNRERGLARAVPALRTLVCERSAVSRETIAAIAALNRARMAAGGGVSAIDAAFEDGLARLAHECGIVSTWLDGDRVIAGAICARVGTGWTLMVIAHDPQHDPHSLGSLCIARTVELAVERGARVFNFMWGKFEYKTRLHAVPVALVDWRFYRTRTAWLLDWPSLVPVWRRNLTLAFRATRRRLHLGRFLPRRHPPSADDSGRQA